MGRAAMANAALERGLAALQGFSKRGRERLALGLAVLLLAVAYGPTLAEHVRNASDPFRFADDARILIPPLFRAADPALFPGDPVTDYFLAGLPDAPRLLYSLFAPLVSPTTLSKILPYVLLVLALSCVGATARRLGGNPALFGALALALGSAHVLGRMVAGLPRAFALPLLFAGVLCLVAGRPLALAALAVLGAAFYPVAGVLLGLSLLGLFLLPASDRGLAVRYSLARRATVLGLTAFGMALVVAPSALRLQAYGPAIDATLARSFPEAGEFGRFDAPDRPPFPALPRAAAEPLTAALVGDGAPLVAPTNLRAHGTAASTIVFLIAVCGFVVLARRRSDARRFAVFGAAVVVAHTLSLVLTPRLFLPERYVAYGVPVLALVGVPAAFSFLSEHPRASVRNLSLVWNLAVLALVGARGASWSGLTVLVPPTERPLYAQLATLPKTSVIAGWPGFAIDSVPYLSQRTAFLTRETHMPFHRRYAELMRERMRALIAAYFASGPEPLRTLHRRYGVTHVLVDRRHFHAPPPYFAPFDVETRAAFALGRARGFELLRAVAESAAAGGD
ncbi:MAG TPA: hypothetical protein VMS65_11070, partial [Polyangiaceae bacterium]|nr:hypothetical protein [Polyangiaceae bacterium]